MTFLGSLFDKMCLRQEQRLNDFIESQNLRSILKPIFKEVSEQNFELLFKILQDTSEYEYPTLAKTQIGRNSYESVFSAWSCCYACDISENDQVPLEDFHFLLFLY